MDKTRLSNKGRIFIPKAIRERHGWKSGLEFAIENIGDGIKLKPIRPNKKTRIDEAIGYVGYKRPKKIFEGYGIRTCKGG